MRKKLTADQLGHHLWSAAHMLRDFIGSSDYKNHIFDLLLLKRLSDRFDEECEALVAQGFDPEDRSKHQFFVPQLARWKRIIDAPEDIGGLLNRALGALEGANPGLEGALSWSSFNFDRRPGDSRERDMMLRQLVQHFSDVDLRNANLFEPSILNRASEYLMENFAAEDGKRGDDFYTPHTIAHLSVNILDPQDGMRICDPACGSGGMLLQCTRHLASKGTDPRQLALYGQERNISTWAICKINMTLNDKADAVIALGDTIRRPLLLDDDGDLMRFDRIISNPPFSLANWGHEAAEHDPFGRFRFGIPPKTRGDLAFVQHMVAALNHHGKLCVIVSHRVLTSGGREGRIRRGLLEEDLIESVLGLPANLFYGTTIPAVVLVVNREKPSNRKGKVLFVEASREFGRLGRKNFLRDEDIEKTTGAVQRFQDIDGYARVVDLADIAKSNFKLDISRYINTEPSKTLFVHESLILMLGAGPTAAAGSEIAGASSDRNEDGYDLFVSYNSRDRAAALGLCQELRARKLRPWIDVHELIPGQRWQDQLERVIETIPAVAVLVGASGLGPWEELESQTALESFVERKAAVIPVLLKDAPAGKDVKELLKPKPFLRGFVAVDLRTEGIERLVRGIEATRRRPETVEGVEPKPRVRKQEAERHAHRLEELYERREQLTVAGKDTRALDAEILDVRRLLRKGPQLLAGEQLLDGRYRLVGSLGKGGFATVWKAYDRKLKRLVAAKVLHGQHADERERRERFFRGSRKMAELVHPHVVRVLEQELDDEGWLFFVMELVSGGDFGRAILAGTLPVSERLRIIRQVGEVLDFAHQRGVVHRDVKPSNILLDEELQPKLTDFDLVRDDDSTGFTQTRAMLGTLNYAAPEALEFPKDAGPPADVYSLASTAVFALRGGPLPNRYYQDPGQSIAELDVSPALAQVLTRATAWNPKERYASAAAFVEALE